MKTKFNIKPVYIALLISIIFGGIYTKIIVNSNNSNTDAIAAIINAGNAITQDKLDGLKDDHVILNENDKTIAAKIDALRVDLGLLKEDVALLQQDITSLGLKVEDNQKALLTEMQGIKANVDNIKKQGYNNVTAQKVISYNRCVTASSAPSTCSSILD